MKKLVCLFSAFAIAFMMTAVSVSAQKVTPADKSATTKVAVDKEAAPAKTCNHNEKKCCADKEKMSKECSKDHMKSCSESKAGPSDGSKEGCSKSCSKSCSKKCNHSEAPKEEVPVPKAQ